MAESEATIGLGTTFSRRTGTGPSYTWVEVGEAVSIQPPQPTRETTDVTHLKSPQGTREYKGTLRAPGEASVTFNHTPAAYAMVSEMFLSDDLEHFRLEYPEGDKEEWSAIVTGKPSEPIEVDGVRRFSMPMQCSGLPAYTAS